VRPRRLIGAPGRPLNFTVRQPRVLLSPIRTPLIGIAVCVLCLAALVYYTHAYATVDAPLALSHAPQRSSPFQSGRTLSHCIFFRAGLGSTYQGSIDWQLRTGSSVVSSGRSDISLVESPAYDLLSCVELTRSASYTLQTTLLGDVSGLRAPRMMIRLNPSVIEQQAFRLFIPFWCFVLTAVYFSARLLVTLVRAARAGRLTTFRRKNEAPFPDGRAGRVRHFLRDRT